ncbi:MULTISPECIES: prealbumin-like fold domain-containing protein [Bacteria]|uniref:prealbumin-like fold domain-containing protein n=1 Tax=Bacteria TaxID=2 RepID=UPI003C7C4D91
MSKTTTRSGIRALTGAAVALLVGAGTALAVAPAAQAEEIDTIVDLSTAPRTVETGTTIDVTVVYTVPEDAVEGDRVTINFSDKVEGRLGSRTITDPAGVPVADCAVTATTAFCTFTDYVSTHGRVSGEATFTVIATRPTNGAGLDWSTGTGRTLHTDTQIMARQGGLPSTLYKGHTEDADGTIHYYFGIPGDDLTRAGLVVRDVYDPRTRLRKESLFAQTRVRDASGAITTTILDPSLYSVSYDETSHSFTVAFTPDSVNDTGRQAYWVAYDMTVDGDVPDDTVLTNTATAGDLTARYDMLYDTGGGEANGYRGSLSWSKEDGEGRLLGGAEFRLIGPSGYDRTVADNGPLDRDVDAGRIRVEGILKGSYMLTETKAPAGYDRTDKAFTTVVRGSDMNPSFGAIVNTPAPSPVPTPSPASVAPSATPESAGAPVGPRAHTGGPLAQDDLLLSLGMTGLGGLAVAGVATAPLMLRTRPGRSDTGPSAAE